MEKWTYGDAWCQVSGITHGTSVTVSIWSISMIGIHRFGPISFFRLYLLYQPLWLVQMKV